MTSGLEHTEPRGADVRRAGWLYLARIGGGLISIGLIAVILVAVGGRKPPDMLSSGDSKNAYFFREKKLARAASISSTKMLVIGGSSALFSVRSEVIEAVYGAPTVNLGVQAGLGLDYILYDARRVIRPHDTVLLILEYEHFLDKGERSHSQADFTFHHDPGWLLKVGPTRVLELAKRLSGRDMLAVLWRGVWSTSVDPARYVAAINERGDVIVNTRERAPLVATRLAEHSSPLGFKGAVISEFSRKELEAFAAWCRDRNVTIVAAPPPFLSFPAYQTNGFFEFDAAIRGLYASLGIESLGMPGSNLFERREFFDTRYHLHGDAANEYSRALAQALAGIPRYEASFRDGIDLSRPGLPAFIQSVKGVSAREGWGRWSDAKTVEWRFSMPPPQPLRMILDIKAFGANEGQDLTIWYGNEMRTVRLKSSILEEVEVRFERLQDSLEMQWVIPLPQAPADVLAGSQDKRTLGIGIRRIRFL